MEYPKNLFKKEDGNLKHLIAQSAEEESAHREKGFVELEEMFPNDPPAQKKRSKGTQA